MVFIITEYFYPFSDAGGPIRSIEQLLKIFAGQNNFKIITSAHGVSSNTLNSKIEKDCFIIEPRTKSIVFYSSLRLCKTLKMIKLYFENRNQIFYINGLFKPQLSILPAFIGRYIIISPRGMLISDTFGHKSLLKKVYLRLFYFIVKNKAIFHATDFREVSDIKKVFGKKSIVKLIPNIPVRPLDSKKDYFKKDQSLRLVYFGLIAKKKGLMELIYALQSCSFDISLDIFGSVKDHAYWIGCQSLIRGLPKNIIALYKGHADPSAAQNILSCYDFFILLTKGENFGHAIYESLSVGTPVIISNKTPWLFDAMPNPPGWNISNNDLLDLQSLKKLLFSLFEMDNTKYEISSKAAHQFALNFYNSQDFDHSYSEMFKSFS